VEAFMNRSHAFRAIKQAGGTYRIIDNTGLYVGVSDAKKENGSNIILGQKLQMKVRHLFWKR